MKMDDIVKRRLKELDAKVDEVQKTLYGRMSNGVVYNPALGPRNALQI